MSTIIIINASDFISEEMKNERKFIKNKSRGHKYLEQESKRTQRHAEQIAQLPKKMRNKLKDDFVKPSFQLKEKNTKKRSITKNDKVYFNTKRNIQDNIDDSEAARLDANHEKWDEQQEEWKALSRIDALRDSDLLCKHFDGEEIVWSEHRLSAKDFCEPELLPVSDDCYSGYPGCHPVSDSEDDYNFWEDYEDYEHTDKSRNPHLYENSMYYSKY